MNPIPEECKYLFKSTTHVDYTDKSKKCTRPKPMLQESTDPDLINGKNVNNLLINNKAFGSCHPYAKDEHEDYIEFIKRLPCVNKNVYCKQFLNPEPQPEILPGIFMENKTVYQKDYSPNQYTSKNENIQLRRNCSSMQGKYEETTYADSYNRISELKNIRDITRILPFCEETRKRILQDELRKIYKTGMTVYHTDICQPALLRMVILNKKNLLKNGPLDQHTLRKL